MTHPCKAGNPGTTLHACGNASARETLCGLTVELDWIDVLVGYTSVCRHCFPKEENRGSGEIEEIGGSAAKA
jgi:hypothetical protein